MEKQGSNSSAVTITANDGGRHFTNSGNVLQIIGVTLSGAGGVFVTRGGVVMANAATRVTPVLCSFSLSLVDSLL